MDEFRIIQTLERLASIESVIEREEARDILRGDDMSTGANELRAQYKSEFDTAKSVLKAYAESLQPATLETMQQKFYFLTNSTELSDSAVIVSAVRCHLDVAWDGVGPWQR